MSLDVFWTCFSIALCSLTVTIYVIKKDGQIKGTVRDDVTVKLDNALSENEKLSEFFSSRKSYALEKYLAQESLFVIDFRSTNKKVYDDFASTFDRVRADLDREISSRQREARKIAKDQQSIHRLYQVMAEASPTRH